MVGPPSTLLPTPETHSFDPKEVAALLLPIPLGRRAMDGDEDVGDEAEEEEEDGEGEGEEGGEEWREVSLDGWLVPGPAELPTPSTAPLGDAATTACGLTVFRVVKQ